jgi:hypothetical protein
MARYVEFTKTLNPHCLVKPTIELQCRPYNPPGKQWGVVCRSGWPMERPVQVSHGLSKHEVRKIAKAFINAYQLEV